MGFEKVVRPYQTVDYTPGFSPTPEGSSNTVSLAIGKNGSGRVLNATVSLSVNTYMDRKVKEDKTHLSNSDIYAPSPYATDVYL